MKTALTVSVVANLLLSVVCLVLVYQLSQVPAQATNAFVAEIEPYDPGEEAPKYSTEIGPWGPPVENMKMHRKW